MSRLPNSYRFTLLSVRWAIIPLVFFLYQTVAASPPLLPHQLYGTVTIEGQTANAIQLHVDGQTFSAELIPYNGAFIYEVDLPTDDLRTAADEGGTDGQTVTVTLPNGHRFEQSTSFASGEVEAFDLTMGAANCLATLDDGATVFVSTDGSAVQRSIDAASNLSTVKIAGTCVGLSVVSAKNVTVKGGYASNDWQNQSNLTVLDAENASRVLHVQNRATMTVESVAIRNGSAENGGGVLVDVLAELTIRNSHIVSNTATANGGGIYSEGTLNLYQSTVEANSADANGGGIYSRHGIIENSTLSGNRAANHGGGLYVGCCRDDSIVNLQHATVASNSAAFGANVFNAQNLTMAHTILADGDGAGSCASDGTIVTNGYNVVEDGNCITADSGDLAVGDVIADALLIALADNGGLSPTHALNVNSPAIGVGGSCPTTDQRSVTRPALCDSGAYQTLLPDFLVTSLTATPVTTCLGHSFDLAFAVGNAGVVDSGVAYAVYDDDSAENFVNQIGTGNFATIAAGAVLTESLTYTPTMSGTRRIKLLLDGDDAIAEANKMNNSSRILIQVDQAARPVGSLLINGGDTWSTSLTVNLDIAVESDPCKTTPVEMRVYLNNSYSDWMPFQASSEYTLPDEVETLYVQLRDANGTTSALLGDTIEFDRITPSATVIEPEGRTLNTSLDVVWEGDDEDSGIASYKVDVQINAGAWQTWLNSTTALSGTYAAQVDNSYCFRATATDAVGLVESVGDAEACVEVVPSLDLDLFPRNLNLTQVVQTPYRNYAPLVENKPLLVRVHVGTGQALRIDNVDANLHVLRNGVELAGSPLKPDNAPFTAKRLAWFTFNNDWLHFRVPDEWLTGELQFYVELDPDNAIEEDDESNNRYPTSGYQRATFNPVAPIEVTIVPIHWRFKDRRWTQNDTYDLEVSEEQIAAVVAELKKFSPTNEIRLNLHTPVNAPGVSGRPPTRFAMQQVYAISQAERPTLLTNQFYFAVMANPATEFPRYQAGYYGVARNRNIGAVMAKTEDTSTRVLYSSGLGIYHIALSARVRGYYPAWDNERNRITVVPVHPDRYRTLVFQLKGLVSRSADMLTPLRDAARENSAQNVLFVSGQVQADGTNGTIESVFELPDANGGVSPTEAGAFRLAMLDSTGVELHTISFEPLQIEGNFEDAASEEDDYHFSLPVVADLASVRLYHNGVLLDEIVAGTVPVVSVTSAPPTTGDYTLTWEGDADTYYVRYSPDNGATWSTLTRPITTTELLIDADYLKGGSSALLEVYGSRDLRSSGALLGPFTIADSLPDVLISGPTGELFESGQAVRFVASAIDLEDGVLDGASLAWSSSLDGTIGTGNNFDIDTLSVGTHTITLTVTDSGSNSVSKTFEIEVIGDATVESQLIVGAGLYEFGADGTAINVVNTGNCLENITIVRLDEAHPNANGNITRDGYWRISQTGCSADDTFSFNLTLPFDSPGAADGLCHWTGLQWDCARTEYAAISITHNNVQMSGDWAVGLSVVTDVALHTRDAGPMMGYGIYIAFAGLSLASLAVRQSRFVRIVQRRR